MERGWEEVKDSRRGAYLARLAAHTHMHTPHPASTTPTEARNVCPCPQGTDCVHCALHVGFIHWVS